MANFKPFLIMLVVVFILGAFLNIFVAPFHDYTEQTGDSILLDVADFIEDGVCIDLPLISEFCFSPVTILWAGIGAVTDFMVEQLTLLSYIPDIISIPILILLVLSLAYTIATLIRGN